MRYDCASTGELQRVSIDLCKMCISTWISSRIAQVQEEDAFEKEYYAIEAEKKTVIFNS